MKKTSKSIVYNKNGFSLIELTVVLIIIAILVAIAVPIYQSSQQAARDRVDEANVRILNSATLQWILEDETNDPRNMNTGSLKIELEGKYVNEWPVSPNGKTYELSTEGLWEVK